MTRTSPPPEWQSRAGAFPLQSRGRLGKENDWG